VKENYNYLYDLVSLVIIENYNIKGKYNLTIRILNIIAIKSKE